MEKAEKERLKNNLLKLKKIDDEIKRRKRNNRINSYNRDKVHLKQLEFHKCLKRNRWVFGGNRSGKTECGAVEAIYMARGNHPYRQNKPDTFGWVVSVSRAVQRDVAQSKILHYLNPEWIHDIVMLEGKAGSPANGIIDYILIKNCFGGLSKIGFKSCETGREKFQGASLDYVWFDEEPPEDIYFECLMRVLDKKGDIFGTMTPLKGLTFVYEHIYLNKSQDEDIWHICMEWADNPYLDKKEIAKLSSVLSKEELEVRRYGKFVNSGGLVYSEFEEAVHVIEPFAVPKEWYDAISIDPGLNNPLSCHWYAVDYDGNVYVIEEHYEAGRDIKHHSDIIKQKSEQLKWHTDSSGRVCALIDSAANQHTLASSKSVSELFYDNGILVNHKVDKNLFSGISRVKSYLRVEEGKAKLYIFKNCVNMIREFKSYWWGSGDTPKKQDDHALDELRYYIMTKPEARSVMPDKSDIQKDKERLIRRMKNKRLKK